MSDGTVHAALRSYRLNRISDHKQDRFIKLENVSQVHAKIVYVKGMNK
jgi:hypothetical protein